MATQVQENFGIRNNSIEFQASPIPPALKALIVAVSTVAAAALGLYLAGLAGLAIGVVAGAGFAFSAIAIINNPLHQADLVDVQDLTDVKTPELAESLVDFYNRLPIQGKPQFNGSVSDQAACIQDWMVQSEEISNLDSLNLSGAGLKKLPKEIRLFVHLKKLNLSFNSFESLPAEIGNLNSLESLEILSALQLQTLPDTIGNLKLLKHLLVSGSKLQALPPEIGSLRSLTKLQLIYNNLEALPPEIGNLNALEIFSLFSNKLRALPPEIGKLASLKRLQLAVNELQALPPAIGNLNALEELGLEGNLQLRPFPAEIGNLRQEEGQEGRYRR